MKSTLLFTCLCLFFTSVAGFCAEKKDAKAELQDLVTDIQNKMKAGQTNEQQLGAELKRFDQILVAHKGEKTDDVAEVAFMRAILYLQAFEKTDKATVMLKDLKANFPDSARGQIVDQVLASIEQQAVAKKVQGLLSVGAKFPDFKEQDVEGKPLSVARFKGKVVLVDFWATWCGPCVAELPNVLATYKKYHGKGFEIIGISLDKDKEALTTFTKGKEMTWPQYFDGKGWQNKLAGQYGITSIPATFLLDGQGKIVAKNLRGDALEQEVAKLIAK